MTVKSDEGLLRLFDDEAVIGVFWRALAQSE